MTDAPTPDLTTSAAVAIRRATSADAAAVAAMVREIAAREDQAAHVHVADEQWRTLLARADVTVLLAERTGRAVGYVSALADDHDTYRRPEDAGARPAALQKRASGAGTPGQTSGRDAHPKRR
jgi:hypothetical protein